MTEIAHSLDAARERLRSHTIIEDAAPFYSVASLAEKLAISERTIRAWLDAGEIPWYRIGAQRRIDPADVKRWLEQRRHGG